MRHVTISLLFGIVAIALFSCDVTEAQDPGMLSQIVQLAKQIMPPLKPELDQLKQLAKCPFPIPLMMAIPPPMMQAMMPLFPGMISAMAQVSCSDVKNAAKQAAGLIKQLLSSPPPGGRRKRQSPMTPDQFVQALKGISPKINQLIKQIAQNIQKQLKDIISKLPPGKLKDMLQKASDKLQEAIDNPDKMLKKLAEKAQKIAQAMPQAMKDMMKQMAQQAKQLAQQIKQMMQSPPS